MAAYVPAQPDVFLDIAERTDGASRHLDRLESLVELVLIMRDHPSVETALRKRLPRWLGRWSQHTEDVGSVENQAKRHHERTVKIGAALKSMEPSEVAVFRHLTFEANHVAGLDLARIAAMLLANRPLASYVHGFLGWTLAQAVATDLHSAWEELAWVIRLNTIDSTETSIATTQLVAGVDSYSSEPFRTASATLLRLLGDAVSAEKAESLRPHTPGERWRRVALFCDTNPHDPEAVVGSNIERARATAVALVPADIWNYMSSTEGDHNLETVTPALARFDPLVDCY